MRGILAAAACAVGLLAAPMARAETLTDALIAAYRNSNLLDRQAATLRAADEDVAQAVSTLRPVVDFALASGYARTEIGNSGVFADGVRTTFDLTASLTLLDFGRRALRIDIAREAVLATRELLRDVEQQVLFDAVDAYVFVQVSQQLLALRESNVRLVTQELRAAQDRFEVGEITRTDVSIAEARLAAARAGLAAAEGGLMIAREAYKAATGAYPRSLARLPPSPRIPGSMEAAQSVALKTHPSILGAQRRVTINELGVELQKANFRPTLSATAGVGIDDTGSEEQTFGLRLSQRVYSGGNQASLLRQSIAARDGARADLAQAGVLIAEEVGNAWASLVIANAQVQAGDRQIRAAQTAFEGVREEASLGARTTLDVLNAEQELLDARVTRIEAEAERYVGVYRILGAMGLLSAEHLQLGIPTYDPNAYYNAVRSAPVHSSQGKRLDHILQKLQ